MWFPALPSRTLSLLRSLCDGLLPPRCSPSATTNLPSWPVNLFLFHRWVHLGRILDSTRRSIMWNLFF